MRFTKNKNGDIIALSYYRGKTVKGIAKCSPEDEYNEELGRKIAEARCNQAVNRHRLEGAQANCKQLIIEAENIKRKLKKATEYLVETQKQYDASVEKLNNIMEECNI